MYSYKKEYFTYSWFRFLTKQTPIHIIAYESIFKEVQGISSQSVFFETPARINNYDIFDSW